MNSTATKWASEVNTYAILGIIVALCGLVFWIRRNGAANERAKEALERLAARNIADEIDNEVHTLPVDRLREEAKQWSPKE